MAIHRVVDHSNFRGAHLALVMVVVVEVEREERECRC